MRTRRAKGEYLGLARSYVDSYVDPSESLHRSRAIAIATGVAIVGAGALIVVVRTVVLMMSPIGLVGEVSMDGFWLAPLILLFPLAPPIAALIARRRQRWRWASWSALPAMCALPLGGVISAPAYAAAVTIALPPRDKNSAVRRLVVVALLALIGVVAVRVERVGVATAAALGAFAVIAAADAAHRPKIGTAAVGAILVVAGCVGIGTGLDALTSRALVPPSPPGDRLMPSRSRVCTGEISRACAKRAASRAGFAVAWIPNADDASPYGLYAVGREGLGVEYVLEEAAGPRGELISVYSGTPDAPRGRSTRRIISGMEVTLWTEVGAPDDVEARWTRAGRAYSLSYLGHPMAKRSRSELLDVASDLVERVQFIQP